MHSFAIICVVYLFVDATICKQPPNIIFILADDLGYGDLEHQSPCHQIKTPNIDYLYSNGRELEWYYAQIVCSPSRTALMTGRYPLHNSINTNNVDGTCGVPLDLEFFPKILKEKSNYKTHAIGKWHMGYYKVEYTPSYRGFDSFFGFYRGGDQDLYDHSEGKYYDLRNDTQPNCGYNCSLIADEYYGQYATYLYSNLAQDIIRSHDKKQPLFIYLAFQNVHHPCECPEEYVDEYNSTISNTTRREFAGKLSILDEAVGNITNTLREYNYLQSNGNTMIIFASDNGGPVHSTGCGGTNYPLRGEKGSVWEGGVRVTSTFWATNDLYSSDVIKGTKYCQLFHVVDWYKTLLSAAGIDLHSINTTNLDSIDHWNNLIGKENENDKYFGVRDNVYLGWDSSMKYIGFRKGWLKIFNGTGGVNKFSGWNPNYCENESMVSTDKMYIDQHFTVGHIPLYNLSNDPNEYWDINNNSEMNQIALNLWNEMVELQTSGVPNAGNDPNCPPPMNGSYCPSCQYDYVLNMSVVAPYCNNSVQ